MNKKSQISAEFMIILGIASIVFIITLSTIDKRNDELYSAKTSLYAKQEADKLAGEINSIALGGDGNIKYISLPETLKDNTDYTLNIYPEYHLVEVSWNYSGEKRHYTSTLISSAITGNISNLKNMSLTLTNLEGGVSIG